MWILITANIWKTLRPVHRVVDWNPVNHYALTPNESLKNPWTKQHFRRKMPKNALICQHHPNGVGTENPLGTHGVRAQIRGSRVARSSCGFLVSRTGRATILGKRTWIFFVPAVFLGNGWMNVLRHVICLGTYKFHQWFNHFLEIMDSQVLTLVLHCTTPFPSICTISHLQGKHVAVSRYSEWFLPGFSGDDVYAVNETI